MPQPTAEQLKSMLAPKLAEAESEMQRLIAEETAIRSQLDAKLNEVTISNAILQQYLAAANDIDTQMAQTFQG